MKGVCRWTKRENMKQIIICSLFSLTSLRRGGREEEEASSHRHSTRVRKSFPLCKEEEELSL